MTIVVNGFLSNLLITNGYASVTFEPFPYGYTDPDAATLIGFLIPNPAGFCTDPDMAAMIGFSITNPAAFFTDPDASSLISP